MIASAIRELAASKNSMLLAAAFFDKKIQVWDAKSQRMIRQFLALFMMGARNLALAPDAGILAAGLSKHIGVVAAYEIPSGKKLWQRKPLIHPSYLQFDSTGKSILCTVNDRSSILRLDAGSGTTIEEIHGIRQRVEGPYEATLIVPSEKKCSPRLINRQRIDGGWHLERLSDSAEKEKCPLRLTAGSHNFAVDWFEGALLDATSSPHSVCFAEMGGPVRCISSEDGKLEWMFDPGTESHVLRVHYAPRLKAFFGVLRNVNNKHNRRLLRFEATSGACERICDLDSDAWDVAFLDVTDQLVTTSGEIRNLSDGALAGRLAFPQREYPDE